MTPHTIRFRDGERMAWPLFRGMMTGAISPSKAVAAQRREPQGAYDQAMPPTLDREGRRIFRGRDQENGGRLNGAYCRATDQFLRDNRLADEDVDAVMQILGKYLDDEGDPMVPVGGLRGPIGNPEPGGAQDRRIALDQFGNPHRNLARAMLPESTSGFARRYPHAATIKVI